MAARGGPPPKPTALRVVEGGGKMRGRFLERARREPLPPLGLHEPPKSFTARQLAIWKRLKEDAPEGLLTKVDQTLFTSYCVAVDVLDLAVERFNQSGGEIIAESKTDSEHRYIVNPHLKEFHRICELIRPMQQELGFTPASRTRIALRKPDGDEDPLQRFLGARKSPTPKRPPPTGTKG